MKCINKGCKTSAVSYKAVLQDIVCVRKKLKSLPFSVLVERTVLLQCLPYR